MAVELFVCDCPYIVKLCVLSFVHVQDGNTLLHVAVLSNLAETLRSLLAHLRTTTSPQVTTSIINHQNNQGSTALHEAAAEGFKVDWNSL